MGSVGRRNVDLGNERSRAGTTQALAADGRIKESYLDLYLKASIDMWHTHGVWAFELSENNIAKIIIIQGYLCYSSEYINLISPFLGGGGKIVFR